MMKRYIALMNNEQGFVLVGAILLILVLIFIGITSSTNTSIEIQIAGNEKKHNMNFYEADGGTQTGAMLVEENISCPDGFTTTEMDGSAVVPAGGTIRVESTALRFWRDSTCPTPTDAARDAYWPSDYTAGQAHTNLQAGGTTQTTPGSAVQMVAGYEGKGKGAAGGGANILYNIISQRIGDDDALATVEIQWRHIIGMEGDCNY